jgi:ATP-dependent Clp protease ATP-binding subunit ClpB
VPLLRERLGEQLAKLPQVKGQEGNLSVGNDLNRLLNLTDKLAQQRGDAYIASELFVLAVLEDKGEAGKALKAAGGDKARLRSRDRQAARWRQGQNPTPRKHARRWRNTPST